jgi:hypothetical protein
LQASLASNDRIHLTWNDAADNESGFKILHASSATGLYSLLATTTANTTGYDDASVSAGANYFYRVVAFNNAGDSSPSNSASATTPPAGVPNAPTALVAGLAGNSVNLSWSAAGNGTTEFSLERAIQFGPFAVVATTPAATNHYSDSPNAAGLLVGYRVRAKGTAGNSAYSETVALRMPGTVMHMLTLQKSGAGGGSVASNPAGLNCGATCSAQFAEGTTIQLDASASAGSAFGTWTGCASSSSTHCTVTMDADVSIGASFAPVTPIELLASLPASSSDGSYLLSWTYSGAAPTGTWTIQESSDETFTSPIAEFFSDSIAPFERPYARTRPTASTAIGCGPVRCRPEPTATPSAWSWHGLRLRR